MSKAFLTSAAMLSCRIFLDSDGVLADFDLRCKEIFGGVVPTKKDGEFWEDFMGDGGFAELPLMPFSEELEPLLRLPEARVLTGTPREPYAETASAQKKEWYSRHFGLPETKVITCMSYEKPRYAAEAIEEGFIPVLIDDREKTRDGWEAAGGIFIHYPRPQSRLDAVSCLQALDDLSNFAHFWKTAVQGGGGTYLGCAIDLPEYKRLYERVTAGNYQLARVIGRESNSFWPCLKGVQDLLAQCKQELAREAEAAELAKPLITGKDLMAAGFKPGPQLGKVLKILKAAQDSGERNREALLKMAKDHL